MIAAAAGAACTASSAVLMSLAGSSASVTALGRAGFALPMLGLLVVAERRRGAPRLPARSRWLARVSGVFLAGDLILWSHSISAIGAGLATVVASFQILIVALLAWWTLRERPRRSLLSASPVMLGGLVLVAGLTGTRAYGAHPGLGAVFGMGSALLFGFFILLLRYATAAPRPERPDRPDRSDDPGRPDGQAGPAPVAGPLFESTLGTAAASLVSGAALHGFRLGPAWPALGWLALVQAGRRPATRAASRLGATIRQLS
jgi:drug/metabolite transporter (DMT)-like permease